MAGITVTEKAKEIKNVKSFGDIGAPRIKKSTPGRGGGVADSVGCGRREHQGKSQGLKQLRQFRQVDRGWVFSLRS